MVVVEDHPAVGVAVDHPAGLVGALGAKDQCVPRPTEARNMVIEATALEVVLLS